MTTVTAVTAFLRAGAVSKTSSRSSRLSRGAGSNVKGAYLWVEIAARQYNPNPLIFGPRRTLAGWWKGCAFPPAQRRVEKFRRGAGRPFQRAALLGEATAHRAAARRFGGQPPLAAALRPEMLPGTKPPHPLGEPTALSHQRGESVIVGYYTSRRKCLPRTPVHFQQPNI